MTLHAFVAVATLLSTQTASRQGGAVDTTALSPRIASMARAGQLPEVAVVVVGPDGLLYESYLHRGPGGRWTTGEPDVRFPLGSVGDLFTAVAVMRLVEEREIELDAPLVRYLPDLDLSDPARMSRLTVRHLLEYRSGLPAIAFFNRRVQATGRLEWIDFVRDPGQSFEASRLDGLLLARLLASVSGPSRDHDPAGGLARLLGSASTVRVVPAGDGEIARGHRYWFGWPVASDSRVDGDALIPVAPMAASARDVGGLLSLLLNGGVLADQRFLSSESAAQLVPAAAAFSPGGNGHALGHGWIELAGEEGVWYREGVSPGHQALVAVVPEQRLGVVVLSARTGGPGPSAARNLLASVVAVTSGRPLTDHGVWERWLHGAALVVALASMTRALLLYRRWKALGRPRFTAHTAPIVARLTLELGLAAGAPLVILLGVTKMSIQAFSRLYPDLGIALIVVPLTTVPAAVWRTLVASETWRHGGERPT